MKSYLGLLTGLVIGGIQHYYYMKMLWYAKLEDGFTPAGRSKKPVAVTLDRFNRR